MILSLRSFLVWSATSDILVLERASTTLVFVEVWDQIQCKSGVNLHYRSNETSLAKMRFQVLIGLMKGEPNNGCTSARGAIVVLQIATVLNATVTSLSIGTPSPIAARVASSSAIVGAVTSCTMRHYGLNYMVTERIPRQTTLAKANNSLSSGVDCVKDGVIY